VPFFDPFPLHRERAALESSFAVFDQRFIGQRDEKALPKSFPIHTDEKGAPNEYGKVVAANALPRGTHHLGIIYLKN